MRLYCPNCRSMYEEPEERFRLQGGRIPCRVCRTELVPQDAPAGFREMGATTVNPPPAGMGAPFLQDDDATVADIRPPRPGAPGQGVSGEAKTTALSSAPGGQSGPMMGGAIMGGAIMGGAIAGGGSGTRPSDQPGRAGGPVQGAITGGAIAGGGSGVRPSESMPRSGGGPPGPAPPSPGYGPSPYGPPQGQSPYAAPPSGPPAPAPHGQSPYGQSPYGQAPYGQSPYGQSGYGSPPAPMPQSGGGQTPYLQAPGPPPSGPSGPRSGGGFHSDPTHVFDAPRPANPPPPMYQQAPQQAPGPMPEPQRPPGDPKKPRRQVVIGGAAGVGSAGEALKTQAFDVKVIEDKTFEAMRSQKMVIPPGGLDAAAAARGPMVVGDGRLAGPQMAYAGAADDTQVTRRRRWPIVVLLLLVLTGIGVGLMALLGVFSGGGSGGGSAETTEGDAPAVAATAIPPRGDRLLGRLRTHIEPPLVSSGGQANLPGYAAGVAVADTGQLTYWLSSGDAPVSLADPAALIAALPPNGAAVFVLFDRRVPIESAVRLIDGLRASGHAPIVTTGSPMGEDVYFGFPADGADSATFRIQLGTRALNVLRGGDTPPETLCYNTVLPNDQLTRASDQVLTGTVDPQIAIEVATGVDLQQVLYLTQATYRPGSHLRLTHSATDFTGPACGQ